MKIWLLALPILAVVLVAILMFLDTRVTPDVPEHIYCAGGTLTCPDGSTVFRMPPDCEFAACPNLSE